MFNKDFYPTPNNLAKKMTKLLDFNDKYILEPSAGKGDLAKEIKGYDRKIDLIECEEDLCAILRGLCEKDSNFRFVGRDFLSYKTNVEYDAIVANPPFSNGVDHVLKMVEIAESQRIKDCKIITLLNAETLKNPYSSKRKELLNKLNIYNAEVEYIENAFTEAERKTDVEVALVYFKVSPSAKNFSYFEDMVKSMKKEVPNTTTELSTKLNSYNLSLKETDVMLLIRLYNENVKLVKKQAEINNKLNNYYSFLKQELELENWFVDEVEDITEKIIGIRRFYWNKLLTLPEITTYLTSNAKEKLRKTINTIGREMEFSLENIELMLQGLIGNKNQILLDSLVEFFEDITKYNANSYSGNIHYYNGWKTNNAFKINKKIVLPFYSCSWGLFGDYNDIPYEFNNKLLDILKIAKLITLKEYSPLLNVEERTYENEFLKVKLFKKGTAHIWFKQYEVIEKLNFLVGQQKNWLPTDEEIKTNTEAQAFVKEIFNSNNFLKEITQ